MRERSLIGPFVLVFLGVLVYSNTFHVPFSFDDRYTIATNLAIRDFRYFTDPAAVAADTIDMVKNEFWTRLLVYITYALNYRINGLEVAGYHTVNLALHILNALMVYRLLRLLGTTPFFSSDRGDRPGQGHERSNHLIAFFSALLFVSHPVATSAVTYVVQRCALLVTFFYLLSIILYIESRFASSGARRRLFYVSSFIAVVCAMVSKENAFTVPLVLLLVEFIFFKGPKADRLRYLAPYFITLLIIPTIIILTVKGAGSIQQGDFFGYVDSKLRAKASAPGVSRLEFLYTQFTVVTTYIRLLFFPINQTLSYDFPYQRSFFSFRVIVSFIALAFIIVSGVFLALRSKTICGPGRSLMLVAFGIFWFFVTLSVEAGLLPHMEIIFEYRLYLPSIGFYIFVAASAAFLAECLGWKNRIAGGAVVFVLTIVVVLMAVTAYARNQVWGTELSIWEDAAMKSPGSYRAHYNLGVVYMEKGRTMDAAQEFAAAVRLAPKDNSALNNLGLVYKKIGRYDDASKQFAAIIGNSPYSLSAIIARNNLGLVYEQMGDDEKAIREYKTALMGNPCYGYARNNLGLIYRRLGRLSDAMTELKAAVSCEPGYAYAHSNLGLVYEDLGRYEEAVTEYREALKIEPGLGEVKTNLERSLKKGQEGPG